MMERQFAKFFIGLVKEVLPDEESREKLFDVLRCYQSNQDLLRLLKDLRVVLDEPSKLELYEFLRPLILLRHQIPYSLRFPTSVGTRLRAVRLQRRVGESLGFAVRGGYEHGTGLFVTDLAAGSQADRQGLRIGDEIVRVNGFSIAEAVHDDVLRLIKSRDDIVLKVRHVGIIPSQEKNDGKLIWKYVDDLVDFNENTDLGQDTLHSVNHRRAPELKIFIDSTGHASIGCSIVTEKGPAARYPGIFIDTVREGSLADQVGLKPGDQILEVNGTSFRGITWEEALLALKSSRQLHFVIRKISRSTVSPSSNEITASPAESESNQLSAVYVQDEEPEPPVAPVIDNPSPTPAPDEQDNDKSDRRYNIEESQDDMWDEDQIIQHQLNMRATRSGHTSTISTSALVHRTQSKVNKSALNKSMDESLYLGGAAAARLEKQRRESLGQTNNSLHLLELEGEFGWTDRVPDRIYQKIDSDILNGRSLKCLTYKKTLDLGIAVEGGVGSPLAGKIHVSVIFEGGVADRSGKLKVGDQLVMLDGENLFDITAADAHRIINKPAKGSDVELIYCESTLVNDEDSVTYF